MNLLRRTIILTGVVSALGAVAVYSSAAHAAAFRFEFVNFDQNGKVQTTFPLGASNEIILASDTTDVRTVLPVAIVIRADSRQYKNAIPNNPELACAGPDRCSIPGPVIPATAKYVEIQAVNTDGEVLATYTVGTPPAEAEPSPSPAAALLAPTGATQSETPTPSNEPRIIATPTPTSACPVASLAACPSRGVPMAAVIGLLAVGSGLAFIIGRRGLPIFLQTTGSLPQTSGPPPKIIPTPDHSESKDGGKGSGIREKDGKKKTCAGKVPIYIIGRCEYNVPFTDEQGNEILPDTGPEFFGMMWEAYVASHVYELAVRDARQRASAECSKECRKRDACGDGYYCGGTADEGVFPPPPERDLKRLPPVHKADPEIKAGTGGRLVYPREPRSPEHRYVYEITGEFICTCKCERTWWQKLKDALSPGTDPRGRAGPRPPVH